MTHLTKEELEEAQVLAREYVLCGDSFLSGDAIELKRALARALLDAQRAKLGEAEA